MAEHDDGHLARLAERQGIVAGFTDVRGIAVRTSPDTQRALLAAMGQPVAGEVEARERLEALDRQERARILPPVLVTRDPAVLSLPAPAPAARRWTIVATDRDAEGAGRSGDLGPGESLIRLEPPLPFGRYRIALAGPDGSDEAALLVAPARCFLPDSMAHGQRLFGLSAQLYALHGADDLGIGSFAELDRLVRFAARHGAQALGLNPLHALFLDQPGLASPYSPASRLFLNPLAIDPRRVSEFGDCEPAQRLMQAAGWQEALARARAADLIDHEAVAALLLPLLEALHAGFAAAADPARAAAFALFRAERGVALERFCTFQAIREAHRPADPSPLRAAGWRLWPEGLRHPEGEAVRLFAERHEARIAFFAWLQWIADEQLGAAARSAAGAGMAIGLYRDLAVGADAGGCETWANPGIALSGVTVGAPPDLFNPGGQDWGLPPFDPNRLRAEAYQSFSDLIAANMRHAGALRIDHVMGIAQLWWVPEGGSPADGAYVRYPMEDMLAVLALESLRQRCLVVGEDLGTVPHGFRERMAEARVLSYRVVSFEWDQDGAFLPPEAYPELSVAVAGSHDLAPLHGWWIGHDIALKQSAGLYPEGEVEPQRRRRREDRARLIEALRRAGLAPDGIGAEDTWTTALADAVHAFLARTRSCLAIAQIEDLAGEQELVNLPGSTDQHPNWRRKLRLGLDELEADPMVARLMALLAAERPAPG